LAHGRRSRAGRSVDARPGRARDRRAAGAAPDRALGRARRLARPGADRGRARPPRARAGVAMTRRVDRGRRLQLTSRPVSGPLMPRPPGADDGGERPREFVQSVERGLAIIRSFGPDSPVQTVSDMAAKTGLTRATARRFLITLMELGYIQTD